MQTNRDCLAFVLKGQIYPYVRTTQRQKWVDKAFGKYQISQQWVRAQVRAQMISDWAPTAQTPIAMAVVQNVSTAMHRRDLDNTLKAIADALQHCLMYQNDAWIDQVFARRRQTGTDICLVVLWFGELGENVRSISHEMTYLIEMAEANGIEF